jgi:hypothetical protein
MLRTFWDTSLQHCSAALHARRKGADRMTEVSDEEKLQETAGKSSLTTKQSRAIVCLLSSRTIADAAKAAQISERTIFRWLKNNSDFRAALWATAQASVSIAARRLVSGQGKALDALEFLLERAQNEAVRRQAALDWLNLSTRFLDIYDFQNRMTRLEKEVFHERKR